MPTNVTTTEYEKAKAILNDAEQPLPDDLTIASSDVEYFFNKNVNCPQSSINLVMSWNIKKFAYE